MSDKAIKTTSKSWQSENEKYQSVWLIRLNQTGNENKEHQSTVRKDMPLGLQYMSIPSQTGN